MCGIKVILIGPRGVGKSSVAEHIALTLGLSHYGLDGHCFNLYLNDPLFKRAAEECIATNSVDGLQRTFQRLSEKMQSEFPAYLESLHLNAVSLALTEITESVVDLGSGHCSYTSEQNQSAIMSLLSPYPVACLWPSQNKKEAVEILNRQNGRDRKETLESLASHRGREFAKHVAYVERKSIAEVAAEVIQWMNLPAKSNKWSHV